MRAKVGWGLVWGAAMVTLMMLPSRRAAAGNCALFVRAQTGVDLYGAAGGWWDEAASRYWRGRIPQAGAILVFKRTGAIPSGHVAVVAQVVGPREIVVDQANWYHGRVTRDVPVVDESPANDWTNVAVMDLGSGKYGRDYPSYGFVYPQTGPRGVVASEGANGDDGYLAAVPAAYDLTPRFGVFHAIVAADDDNRRRYARRRTAGRGSQRRKPPAQMLHAAVAADRPTGHAYSFARLHPAAHARSLSVHAEPARYPARVPATPRAEAKRHQRT